MSKRSKPQTNRRDPNAVAFAVAAAATTEPKSAKSETTKKIRIEPRRSPPPRRA